MKPIEIPYAPRQWALTHLHNRKERWIVLVIHRRGGKTTATLNHLQRDALNTPLAHFAFIAPTYKQVKRVAWDMAKFYARKIPGVEFNEVDLKIRYPNGSTLTLYGADNPDALRGIGLWGVAFDEYSQQPSNIFTEVVAPTLADHKGYAIWIGTPKGRNEFCRLYEMVDGQGKPIPHQELWHTVKLTVADTKIIDDTELSIQAGIMSKDEFQQEYYCNFDAAIKGAVFGSEISAMREDGRVGIVPYDKALKVYPVLDRGVGENLVCGFFQRAFGQLKMIDVWQGSGNDGLPELLATFQKKPYIYGRYFGPHDIEGTDSSTGKTWRATAAELGVNFDVVPKVSVEDRIKQAQIALTHTWVDKEKCAGWLDATSQYHYEWDERMGMFKEKPAHDWTSHWADMFCYAAVSEELMDNETEKQFRNINGADRSDPYDRLSPGAQGVYF